MFLDKLIHLLLVSLWSRRVSLCGRLSVRIATVGSLSTFQLVLITDIFDYHNFTRHCSMIIENSQPCLKVKSHGQAGWL